MKTIGRTIDFVRNGIDESTANFLVIILNLILHLILKSNFLEKNSCFEIFFSMAVKLSRKFLARQRNFFRKFNKNVIKRIIPRLSRSTWSQNRKNAN